LNNWTYTSFTDFSPWDLCYSISNTRNFYLYDETVALRFLWITAFHMLCVWQPVYLQLECTSVNIEECSFLQVWFGRPAVPRGGRADVRGCDAYWYR